MQITRALVASFVVTAIGCASGTPPGAGFKVDPWGKNAPTGGAVDAERAGDNGGGFPGFGGEGGLEAMVKMVMENVKKPGPYEAPDHGSAYAADKPHVGVIELSGAIVEREAYSFSPLGGASKGTELRALIQRFEQLAGDANLTGLLARVDGMRISMPDAIELRATLHAFRAKGKQLTCFTEGVSGVTYLVMAACDRIAIAPLGEVVLAGPAAMPIHLKPLLDSLGVKADFLHVGAYKGAAEPLTRDAPSAEMLEVLGQILDRHYQTMVDIVAADRAIGPDQVKAVIDEAMFDPKAAQAAKLVDEVSTWEALRTEVAGDAWTELSLGGDDEGGAVVALKAMQFLGMTPPSRPSGPHVALVYAVGDVVDGEAGGVLGARSEIASGTLVAALRALTADDDVKAVVLRIDSGGGSALASELIWHAVADLKAKKPVVVSMSDVAASGGYYIAAGATKIFALEDTLTGSIGVVGGKLAIAGALDKFGVKTYPIGRGKRATMFASLGAWSPDERAAVQKSMESVYEVFVSRVAAGRGKTAEEIKPIAQGHVWTGARAKELGLVDELGGLDAAIASARELAGVDATAALEVYPPTPTLRDFVHGFGGVQAALGLGAASQLETALAAMPVELATQVRRLLGELASFQADPIQARAFLPTIVD